MANWANGRLTNWAEMH